MRTISIRGISQWEPPPAAPYVPVHADELLVAEDVDKDRLVAAVVAVEQRRQRHLERGVQ